MPAFLKPLLPILPNENVFHFRCCSDHAKNSGVVYSLGTVRIRCQLSAPHQSPFSSQDCFLHPFPTSSTRTPRLEKVFSVQKNS